jgi:hypothetical protein
MELKTRRVHIAGIVHQPHGAWMMQVGRNLLDATEGLLLDKRYRIRSRPGPYGAVPAPSARQRGYAIAVAGEESVPERARGALREIDSRGLSQPRRAAR